MVIVDHYCGLLLWIIIVDYYCGLLLWIIIVDYYGFKSTQGIKVEASSQVRRRRQVRVALVVANAHV